MCGRSCKSQSLRSQEMESLLPQHWAVQESLGGRCRHCCSPNLSELRRHLDGESKDSSLTGRGCLQTYKQEKTRPLFLMLWAQGGKDEVLSLHTTTHTLPWAAEVPLCCVTSSHLLPHGQLRWVHSSWHNKVEQHEKGKRDIKRTPCLRNQMGKTLKASMMMEIEVFVRCLLF